MTVIPFPVRDPAGTALPTHVRGGFLAPDGRRGTFRGTYRLERVLWQSGQLCAAGVFTGALEDADTRPVGLCSRRVTVAAEMREHDDGAVVRLGPLDVNLLGLFVHLPEVEALVPRSALHAVVAR